MAKSVRDRITALESTMPAMNADPAVAEEREYLEGSLIEFLQAAWPHVEPRVPFVRGRHLEAISAHLEAVSRGDLRSLIVNIPPRMGKSTTLAVAWPAWVWRASRTRNGCSQAMRSSSASATL